MPGAGASEPCLDTVRGHAWLGDYVQHHGGDSCWCLSSLTILLVPGEGFSLCCMEHLLIPTHSECLARM